MSETKLVEELLCLDIFQEEGGFKKVPQRVPKKKGGVKAKFKKTKKKQIFLVDGFPYSLN